MKHITRFALPIIFFILAGCAAPATPTPVIPAPTQTEVIAATLAPSETPIQPSPTVEPSATPNPLLFRDDFEGVLADGWSWTRENKKTWSITNNPGWLEIIASPGYVGSANLDNILLRAIPEGNFEMEVKVNFKPVGDYQLAGLLVYESATNYIQFGRAFCDAPNVCAGDGFYVDLVTDNNLDPDNLATAAPESEMAYLRLRREGNKYTVYASPDGQEWQLIGEKISEMKPLFIGLMAGQAWSAPQPAQFDYFVVNQLP